MSHVPFLWILKGSVISATVCGATSASFNMISEDCCGRRRLRRYKLWERRDKVPSPTPDDDESGGAVGEDTGEYREFLITRRTATHMIEAAWIGGMVGWLAGIPLAFIYLKHATVKRVALGAIYSGMLLSPMWIIYLRMGPEHVARNIPHYTMRMMVVSSAVVILCGPASYFLGGQLLRVQSISQLKKMSAQALHEYGVTDGGKHLLRLLSAGTMTTLTNSTVLKFVSGVRVAVYGQAALFVWVFANRYPVVQLSKPLREEATRGERALNKVAVVTGSVVCNLMAGCWFWAAVTDVPGVIPSDWLMIWPAYILSYCIMIHLQSPSDEHDLSNGVAMWRAMWFTITCASVLPRTSSPHWTAIMMFLGAAGYAGWLGTFNGEWQKLGWITPAPYAQEAALLLANPVELQTPPGAEPLPDMHIPEGWGRISLLRRYFHKWSAAAGFPWTWGADEGFWVCDVPQIRMLRVKYDRGGMV